MHQQADLSTWTFFILLFLGMPTNKQQFHNFTNLVFFLVITLLLYEEDIPGASGSLGILWKWRLVASLKLLLRATREARSPNLLVVIRHASNVCSKHSFGLTLRMSGMYRTQFDPSRLDLLSLAIWSRVFWPSVTWNFGGAQRLSKCVLTFGCCRLHSLNFWLLLVVVRNTALVAPLRHVCWPSCRPCKRSQ